MPVIKKTLGSISNFADKLSELITNINKKLRHDDIDDEKIEEMKHTNIRDYDQFLKMKQNGEI